MKLLKALAPAWTMVLAYAVFCLWARTQLPDRPMATHFNVHLQPDRWRPRDQALFAPLAVCAAFMALLTLAPFIFPPRGALERSAKAYGMASFGIVAFFAVAMGGTIGLALGWPIGIGQVLAAAMGLLFLLLGNFMTKVRPNFIFGVRTPWTLANEEVWDKTHRMAGPAMMAAGLFVLAAGLLRPQDMVPVILIGAAAPALGAVVYSWWLWSKLPPGDKRRMRIGA